MVEKKSVQMHRKWANEYRSKEELTQYLFDHPEEIGKTPIWILFDVIDRDDYYKLLDIKP